MHQCTLSRLRTLRAKKFLRLENLHTNSQSAPDEDSMTSTTAVSSKVASDDEDDKDDEEEEEEEVESCDESDATNMTGNRSEDVSCPGIILFVKFTIITVLFSFLALFCLFIFVLENSL